MIIFCAGLRSSASTLQWQIAKHIVENKGLGFGFIVNNGNSINPYLHTDQLVVVKQHKLDHINYIRNSDALVLMTVRDLRDVQCSLMQRWHKPFEYCFERLKVYVTQQREWCESVDEKVYIVPYEYFIPNIEDEIVQIASQLCIEIDSATASSIANTYSLENNKLRLSKNHIIDAQIGKYQTLLTPSQIECIETEFKTWFVDFGYELC